jgi:predicted nucleic acid-binding protein
MSTYFADTSFLVAFLNSEDECHDLAYDYMANSAARFISTWWVVAVAPVAQKQFDRGMDLYERRPDKDWSLTDCISFIVMKEKKLTEALTTDHHFEQAGFAVLLRP